MDPPCMPCKPYTRIYGLIGSSVRHSLSPAIHCAVFRYAGVNAFYSAWEPGSVIEFILGARHTIAGFNITIPFKEAILGLIDSVEGAAREIGAVNTVRVDKGRLVGFNTDYLGVARCLEGARGAGKALVVGAGGAAKAAVYALARVLGVGEVVVVNRSRERAVKLAEWAKGLGIDVKIGGLGDAAELGRGAEVIVNATPLGGMCCPGEMPPVGGLLGPGVTVLDMVYYPLKTRLLREAEARGARVVDGLCMLVWQALHADKIWVGVEPSEELYRVARRAALEYLQTMKEEA